MFRFEAPPAGRTHVVGLPEAMSRGVIILLLGAASLAMLDAGCAPTASRASMITIHPADGVRVPARLRQQIDALRGCYRAALRKRPDLSGELELRLVFADTGVLKTFSSSSELPKGLLGCIRDRVVRWEIRPQAVERTIGPVRVSFRPVREVHRPTPRARPKGVVVWPESLPRPKVGDSVGAKIERIVRERVASLRYCYNRALIKRPNLRAAARISFSIDRYGRPYKIRVRATQPGMLSQQMTSCLRRQLVDWHFFRLPIDVRYGPLVVKFERRW